MGKDMKNTGKDVYKRQHFIPKGFIANTFRRFWPFSFSIQFYTFPFVLICVPHNNTALPAFLSPRVAQLLVDTFGIAGIGTVEEDLARFFGA